MPGVARNTSDRSHAGSVDELIRGERRRTCSHHAPKRKLAIVHANDPSLRRVGPIRMPRHTCPSFTAYLGIGGTHENDEVAPAVLAHARFPNSECSRNNSSARRDILRVLCALQLGASPPPTHHGRQLDPPVWIGDGDARLGPVANHWSPCQVES
jgi:hypothetical protein